MSTLRRFTVAATVVLSALAAIAAPGDLLHAFQDPTPATDENFGDSVACYGTQLLIGATYENTAGANVGRAYLFDSDSGNLIRPIPHPAPVAGDFFGSSVAWATTGTSVYISARGRDVGANTQVGAVYKISAATGALEATIANPEPVDSAFFGGRIHATDSRLFISSPARNRVYVFSLDGTYITTINPGISSADFGYCITTVGDKVVIGAPGYNLRTGRVYIYTDMGVLDRIIDPPSGGGAGFGFDIANLNGELLISHWYGEVADATAGVVYVYSLDGTMRLNIPNPTPENGDQFGRSVASVGNHIAVGASLDNTVARYAGAVYIFDSTSGALKRTITNPQIDGWNFGYSIAATGVNLLIGAPGNSINSIWGGRAYLYHDPALPVSLSRFSVD